jgi:hypothetical protein
MRGSRGYRKLQKLTKKREKEKGLFAILLKKRKRGSFFPSFFELLSGFMYFYRRENIHRHSLHYLPTL